MNVGDRVRLKSSCHVGRIVEKPWHTTMLVVEGEDTMWRAMYDAHELELVDESA